MFSLACLVTGCLSDPFQGFANKDDVYYRKLTEACVNLISTTSIGTNSETQLDINSPAIPRMVKDINPAPTEAFLTTNRVWFMCGFSRAGFGVTVERDKKDTSVWVLRAVCEGLDRELFKLRSDDAANTGVQFSPLLRPN
jgi:hypothetical protein